MPQSKAARLQVDAVKELRATEAIKIDIEMYLEDFKAHIGDASLEDCERLRATLRAFACAMGLEGRNHDATE